jgi:hypothetical protein
MLKKNRILVLIFAMVAIIALPLVAQAQVNPADFANEPALTDKDVDIFIGFTQFTAQSMKAGTTPVQADLDKFASDNGITTTRLIYLTSKIGTAYAISLNPTAKDAVTAQMPDYLKPTEAELNLVTTRQKDITDAQMAVMSN